MNGYSSRQIAKLLDLSVGQIRAYARDGFIQPRRGPRGAFSFSFQDLVLLRTAQGLRAARIPARKIRTALLRLKDQLPTGRPLTALKISAAGDRVVVRDGRKTWDPESGQICLDFEVADLARKVAPHARRVARQALSSEERLTTGEWFDLGCELEAVDPEHARSVYGRALEMDPRHPEAHVNLGRLLHEVGEVKAAEAHYRLALESQPADPTALYNLAVALEDQGTLSDAILVYNQALAADPACADAHYNLARLHEGRGETSKALQHFNSYRRLTRS